MVSGDKLLAIITDGYKEAKSKAIVGIKLIPFLGEGTNAPGYLLKFLTIIISYQFP